MVHIANVYIIFLSDFINIILILFVKTSFIDFCHRVFARRKDSIQHVARSNKVIFLIHLSLDKALSIPDNDKVRTNKNLQIHQ